MGSIITTLRTFFFGPEERETHMLTLNLNDNIRYFSYVGFKEGVQQAKKVAANSSMEESWVYLPHEQVWIETGIGAAQTEDEISVSMDSTFIHSLLDENEDVWFIHIHPSNIAESFNREQASPVDVLLAKRLREEAKKRNCDVRFFIITEDKLIPYSYSSFSSVITQN